MATYSSAQSIAVKQAATGGYVVQAGEFVECNYIVTSLPATVGNGPTAGSPAPAHTIQPVVTRFYGPGQTVQSSFSSVFSIYGGALDPGGGYTAVQLSLTYSLSGGVVFKNMPS
jgi:hypothetical protein